MFGRRKPPPPSLQDRLRRAQAQVNNMEMRSEVIAKRMCEFEAAAIRKLRSGNRAGATLAMKQKKLLEAEHNRVQGQIMNVTRSVLAMEQALASSATAECLKGASDALAVANAEHGDVDVVVENFAEACDDAQDVTDQLAAPLGDVEDDDALLAELGMGPEAAVLPAPAAPPAAAAAPAAPAAPTADALGMPRAPTAPLSLEDEMKQLEREAMAT